MKKAALKPWGPWKDNPSKPQNFYESLEIPEEELLNEESKIKKEEDKEEEDEGNYEEEIAENLDTNTDPYSEILKDL